MQLKNKDLRIEFTSFYALTSSGLIIIIIGRTIRR